jgi:hypothetical protein
VYAALWHAHTGTWPQAFVLDVVARGRAKSPKPVVAQIEVPITPALVAARLADFEAIAQEMQTGRFPRRPSGIHCGKCVYKIPCFGDLLPLATRPSLEPILKASWEALEGRPS